LTIKKKKKMKIRKAEVNKNFAGVVHNRNGRFRLGRGTDHLQETKVKKLGKMGGPKPDR